MGFSLSDVGGLDSENGYKTKTVHLLQDVMLCTVHYICNWGLRHSKCIDDMA